ncbi:acyl-coenzyme A synthetase ACSM3, mitochondrial-like isoform X2 [Erythrolamprus reginae]|uniref:acyl-coenzyme A synthetase ACSM3, mitochondrial-like isoform X2 n=1 Tax=Erythrolamprus reginae TaxID=121349 RepID=UPI00396D036F
MACVTLTIRCKVSAARILQSICLVSSRSFSRSKIPLAAQNFTDYKSICEQYKPEVPEYFNFARDVVDSWAQSEKEGRRPSSPALWWVSEQGTQVKWSFAELASESQKAARVLSEQGGLREGDRVVVILPRIPEWWLLNLACIRTGTVIIPGTTQLTAKDFHHRLEASKAKCVITDSSLAPVVDMVAPKCPSLELKFVVSKEPREGWLSFSNMLEYWLDLTPSDLIWNTSDTGWGKSAWSSVFGPWSQGAGVFVHHMPRFDPKLVLEMLSKFPITTFCSAPTVYRMLVQHDLSSYKFQNLKHCVSAGEPINPEVMDQWKTETGLDVYEGYGQTETVLVCGTFKGMEIKPGSVGKPTPVYDTQVIDENGDILPVGKEGDVALRIKPRRPFSLFTQYTDDQERTASTLRGDFYVTGDRGFQDEDGYIWLVGRSDDVINSAGYRIGPFEVENALIEHDAVVEAAVVSSPDPIRGEVVKAFVVLAPEYTSHDQEALIKELQDYVKTVTAPYKYPRKMEFVSQLPKTISGKIRRNELRKKEWGRA